MKLLWILLASFYVTCVHKVKSARILGFFPTWGRSHLIIEMSVIQTMIEKGHDVTVVTSLPLFEESPNYRHIKLNDPIVPSDLFKFAIHREITPWNFLTTMIQDMDFALNISVAVLGDPSVKKLMQEKPFDLVVMGLFYNQFHVGIAAHFKCPLIIVDTHKPLISTYEAIGNPLEMFYVPGMLSMEKQPLSFTGRVKNVLLTALDFASDQYLKMRVRSLYNDFFPSKKYPPYDEAIKNTSLIFHTSHFSEGPIRPDVPAFVQIGGVQIKPKQDPLPENIRSFMDNATEHGVIFFSLGTNAKTTDLNPKTMKMIQKVLIGLKQRVIWKWDHERIRTDFPNILYVRWLPQNDILAHPNLKLFITHCGMGSMAEAQYHGVPMVAMPLFGDQFQLANLIELSGFGLQLNYNDIKEGVFRETILEVIQNPKYRTAIKRFSTLFRDRPMSARDTAAYWMEYVIRHRGAKHLQSPVVHMSTIEYLGLDVIGFLSVLIYAALKLLGIIFRVLCALLKKSDKDKRE